MNTALILGPITSVILFHWYGDVWDIKILTKVLYFGLILAVAGITYLFYFDDDESHELKVQAKTEETYLLENEGTPEEEYVPSKEFDDELDNKRFLCFQSKHVPIVLFSADFVISVGAGMTINFFPLFFKEEYGMTPSDVNWLFVMQPIVIICLNWFAQSLCGVYGRMPVIVFTRFFSTVSLFFMTYAKPMWLSIILFLFRGGMMRCSQPLRRSVLMDHVPRHHRARWNSLEGLTMFSWSGSAVFGGYLIDAFGYRQCFFLTSMIYFIGMAVEAMIIPLAKKEDPNSSSH